MKNLLLTLAVGLVVIFFSCQKETLTFADNNSADLIASERGGGRHHGDSLHVHGDSLHVHGDSLHCHGDSLHFDSIHIHHIDSLGHVPHDSTHVPHDTIGGGPHGGGHGGGHGGHHGHGG